MKPETLYRRAWRALESREQRLAAKAAQAFDDAGLPGGLAIRDAATDDGPVEVLIYDEIGYWGVTAKGVVMALAQISADKAIRVRINSPGGDVFDGLAIYNALRARKGEVVCVVDGVAASAASFIACAGSRLEMAEQSMLMIHNAWGLVVGNKGELTAMAEVLGKIDAQLAAIYATKSGKPLEDFAALMDAETWLTAEEAKEVGLCDADPIAAPAQARFMRPPKALAGRGGAHGPAPARGRLAASLPAYDPDGDGDNDAEAAVSHLRSVAVLVEAAIGCLTGEPAGDMGEDDGGAAEDPETPGGPIVPNASAAPVEPEPEPPAPSAAELEAAAEAERQEFARAQRLRRLRIAEAESL